MPCDEDLLLRLCNELEELAAGEYHPDCMGQGSKMTKCCCLHVFRNHAVRMVAANAILAKMNLPKDMEDAFFIQSAHYVLAQSNAHNKGAFVIPFSNSVKGSKDELCEILPDEVQALNTKFLCTNGILLANQRSGDYWKAINQKAVAMLPLLMEIRVGRKF
jgi:hypothetical protein